MGVSQCSVVYCSPAAVEEAKSLTSSAVMAALTTRPTDQLGRAARAKVDNSHVARSVPARVGYETYETLGYF